MSSPFAALGLDEDADERAVKRAYAQRLKSARPDEDPEAFQALNSAYKAALAAVRRGGQADAELRNQETAADLSPREAPLPIPAEPAPMQTEIAAAAEPDAAGAPFAYATARDDGGLEFDFDAFSADLFRRTADPSTDLKAWLAREMADWPLAMKPTLAPYLLSTLDEADAPISPKHFATLADAFGLDDVQAGVDPVAVELLRKANERRWTTCDAVERGRRLLAPGNSRELDQRTRVGGYWPWVSPALARLVTGPGAARRTGLRWVPLLSRWVLNLLRYVSDDNVEALSPPLEAKVLARWRLADRTIGKVGLLHLMIAPVAAFFAFGIIAGMWDAATKDSFKTAMEEQQSDPEQAVRDYVTFINDTPQPWYGKTAADIATAYFNRGYLLKRLHRTNEALLSYKELEEAFPANSVREVQLQVAKSRLDTAYLLIQEGDYRSALEYARKVTDRYSDVDDEALGDDGFALQVVKGLSYEAYALDRLGNRRAGALICARVLDRYKNTKSEAMKDALNAVRGIKRESEAGLAGLSNSTNKDGASKQESQMPPAQRP